MACARAGRADRKKNADTNAACRTIDGVAA
jgi:hypothetical protein